jgi:D-3-phosphoglycerate dehydrogenase / 2-oxoglutarate reductase
VKVLVTDPMDAAALARLRSAGHELVEHRGVQGAELAAALAGCQALLVRGATKVTAEVLRLAPDLRVVVRAGTGLDNVDLDAARARDVAVHNTPAANAISVAELVFGLLIALERHLVPASADLKRGHWEKTRYQGRDLAGRTLGLLGFGRIGREVAVRARAFAMTVRAADPLLPAWPPEFGWVQRGDIETLLPEVDVLSLHLPLTPATRGLIGARELARMRPDAVVVNCARGGVVDEEALLRALRSGALRGAALDVFAVEPPGPHPLLELPNVIATPHLGASTADAQARAGLEAADILIDTLARITA